MSKPMQERARELYGLALQHYHADTMAAGEDAIEAALLAAKREGMEEACKATCPGCRRGDLYLAEKRMHDDGLTKERAWCLAAAIRARMEECK